MDDPPSYQFLLDLHENFTRDNGFMAVFYIVLGDKTVVFNSLFCKEVHGVSFLKECISDVFFIPEDLIDVAGAPFVSSGTILDAISLKPSGNL